MGYSNELSDYSLRSKERIDLVDELLLDVIPILNKISGEYRDFKYWKILLLPYLSCAASAHRDYAKYGILDNRYFLSTNTIFTIGGIFTSSVKNLRSNIIKLLNRKDTKSNTLAIGFKLQELSFLPECDYFWSTESLKLLLYERFLRFFQSAGTTVYETENPFVLFFLNNIPRMYVSKLSLVEQFVAPSFNKGYDSILISGFPTLKARLLVAYSHKRGTTINYIQHGSVYGEFRWHNAHYHESSFSDKFYTWGWTIGENDLPFCAYRCMALKERVEVVKAKKHRLQADYILIILPSIGSHNSVELSNNLNIILAAFPNEDFVLRPRPGSLRGVKKLKLQTKRNYTIAGCFSSMETLLSSVKCVIQLHYPSTSFYECIFLDIPVVSLNKDDGFTSEYIPYIQFFEKRGLMHSDSFSLINFLKNTDLISWWSSVINDPMYNKFKNSYIRDGIKA